MFEAILAPFRWIMSWQLGVAAEAVERVREGAGTVHLDPMGAYERKIVHDVVADAGLSSESEGEGSRRHVVISADGRPELVAQVHAAGLEYLPKPVKPAALRALLSRHLPLR